MFHRDVERYCQRPGVAGQDREHVGHMVVTAVHPGDHDVDIHLEDVSCPACLESRQRGSDLRAGRGARAWGGNAEPPPVQRGGGPPVAGAFDDPVDPTGIQQAARFAAQIAQASARVLPEESILAGVDHQDPLGERPRLHELRDQVGHLHIERGCLHGACLDLLFGVEY